MPLPSPPSYVYPDMRYDAPYNSSAFSDSHYRENIGQIRRSNTEIPTFSQRHDDASTHMHRSPASFAEHHRTSYNAYGQQKNSRDNGREQLGVRSVSDPSSDRGETSYETSRFDTYVTAWQDGDFAPRKPCNGILMKYDTQCENSNWITADIVGDLHAIRTQLPECLTFRGFNGGAMIASEEVQLTWREVSAAGPGPRRKSRFFIAPENDTFEMVLGQKDLNRFGILRLSVQHQEAVLGIAGLSKTKADKEEDVQRKAIHEAEMEARERRRKKRENKSRQTSANTSTQSSRQNTHSSGGGGYLGYPYA